MSKRPSAFGVTHCRIITRHLLPNVMHVVLITVVIDFSGLVLAEAVLSYVEIGVDPTMNSWGNMINSARLEMARDPMVWWSLLAAFLFMFVLVLAANLFRMRSAMPLTRVRVRARFRIHDLVSVGDPQPLLTFATADVVLGRRATGTRSGWRQFEIHQREIFALLGESGCGKSMTALSILRLLPNLLDG